MNDGEDVGMLAYQHLHKHSASKCLALILFKGFISVFVSLAACSPWVALASLLGYSFHFSASPSQRVTGSLLHLKCPPEQICVRTLSVVLLPANPFIYWETDIRTPVRNCPLLSVSLSRTLSQLLWRSLLLFICLKHFLPPKKCSFFAYVRNFQ